MTESTFDLPEGSIVALLRSYLQQLAPLFQRATLNSYALMNILRDKMNALRYNISPRSPLQPLLLVSCQVIPGLGTEGLAQFLLQQALPPARFMGAPPLHFDCAMVPAGDDVGGSGYVFYFDDSLVPGDVYFLLAHAYGHLIHGHLRKGDEYSHCDI